MGCRDDGNVKVLSYCVRPGGSGLCPTGWIVFKALLHMHVMEGKELDVQLCKIQRTELICRKSLSAVTHNVGRC